MSELEKYIEYLKQKISEKGEMNEVEIMRYVYIDLGKKMDFDLRYTFGNSKERKKIYNEKINEEELNHIIETHTAICKSLAYLVKRILGEFNIEASVVTEEGEKNGKHVFNVVELKDGRRMVLDLEADLENIQSGSMTDFFGTNLENEDEDIVSWDELREIDINKADYIPDGYYFEDMIDMLKKAISSPNISLEEKLEFVLENLNVYIDNRKVQYREKMMYYERVFDYVFSSIERRKIHQIDAYKKDNGDVNCKNILILDLEKKEKKVYLFSQERNRYENKTMEDIVNLKNEGFITRQGIPGLRAYLNNNEEIEK